MLVSNMGKNITMAEALFDDDLSDLLDDLQSLERKLYDYLLPVIRESISKKGLSWHEDIYAGFDTEFVNINPFKNFLLSVQ